ncbi:MAG TPA: hypothetical protein VGF42_05655 [Caulobacteraceae bacterium]
MGRFALVVSAPLLLATPAAAQMMGSMMGVPPQPSSAYPSPVNPTGMNSTPVVTYDPATHERITYSLSRESGGFIEGVNIETHKAWHADVRADRSMTGKDADGDAWKYDYRTKTYTNLATGRTCVSANLRHVCGS